MHMARKRSRKGESLASVVGQPTYEVWTAMLRELVPGGRTHRLAPLVAGMLQYACAVAQSQAQENPEEGSVAHALLQAAEGYDPEEMQSSLRGLVERLFEDAQVEHGRASARGIRYSIAEEAMEEFIRWDDMPWE